MKHQLLFSSPLRTMIVLRWKHEDRVDCSMLSDCHEAGETPSTQYFIYFSEKHSCVSSAKKGYVSEIIGTLAWWIGLCQPTLLFLVLSVERGSETSRCRMCTRSHCLDRRGKSDPSQRNPPSSSSKILKGALCCFGKAFLIRRERSSLTDFCHDWINKPNSILFICGRPCHSDLGILFSSESNLLR